MTRERVEIGDWSNDGHCQSETYFIEVPPNINSFEAIKVGESIVGFSMSDFCCGYEESDIPVEKFKKIIETANKYNSPISFLPYSDYHLDDGVIKMSISIVDYFKEDKAYLSPNDYFTLWLAIMNIGIAKINERNPPNIGPIFAYQITTTESRIHYAGGSGLFS